MTELQKKMDPTQWHQDLCLVRERIDMRANHLSELEKSFRRMYQDGIADELALDVKVLRECSKSLSGIAGVLTVMHVHGAEEASRNMLNAALAGVELGGRVRAPPSGTVDSKKDGTPPQPEVGA